MKTLKITDQQIQDKANKLFYPHNADQAATNTGFILGCKWMQKQLTKLHKINYQQNMLMH